ncbi:hypothetical protein HUJ05_009696 [Dendroctonus ponderosae]|nr:hypothetical protein HUJ05_009696 [Dendroctonus ponderosae]
MPRPWIILRTSCILFCIPPKLHLKDIKLFKISSMYCVPIFAYRNYVRANFDQIEI